MSSELTKRFEALRVELEASPPWTRTNPEVLLATIDAAISALRSLESPPSATRTTEPTEAMVEAAANIIAATSLIDSPKLLTPCWMGLARSIVKAALSAAPQPGAQEAVAYISQRALDRLKNPPTEVTACEVFAKSLMYADIPLHADPMSARPEELPTHHAWTNLTDHNVANICAIEASRLNSRCDINKNFAIGEPFARGLIAVLREAERRLDMNNSEGLPK